MESRKISLLSIVTAVAPLILLAIAVLFLARLWLVYCFDLASQELLSYSLRISWAIGALTLLLACLGLLLIMPTKNRFERGQRSHSLLAGISLCVLSGASIVFLSIMKWGYRWADESPFGLWSHFTIAGMVFGIMTFSLAYLGSLFVSSSQSHAWQGLRPIAFSVVLYVSALMGSRYWYNYLEYPPGWRALFILSPLILFTPAALSYYLGSGRWKQSAPSRAKRPSIPIGRIYFSAYVVSLVLYVSIVYFGGRLSFSGGDNDFINTIEINVAFWFLLPVQAGALIVYTLASGKAGGNWVIVIARLVLCVIFAFICYSALERLPHTSMFW